MDGGEEWFYRTLRQMSLVLIFLALSLKEKQNSRHSGWFLKKVYFTLQDFLLAVATCNTQWRKRLGLRDITTSVWLFPAHCHTKIHEKHLGVFQVLVARRLRKTLGSTLTLFLLMPPMRSQAYQQCPGKSQSAENSQGKHSTRKSR